ncbi:MAG: hypothetical protein IKG46_13860 [Solobacterium sp.]|nr:hypothetical protein [Solobacterium sp.]MBR3358900.1 hypothetical protein [Solobacterium sp.]
MRKTHNFFVLILTLAACMILGAAFIRITEAETELRQENTGSANDSAAAEEAQISEEEPADVVEEEPHVHTEVTAAAVETVESTCTEEGHKTTAFLCDCGTELRRETEILAPLGHNYDPETGICSRCGLKDPEFVKIYSSKDIVKVMEDSAITSSGTTAYHLGNSDLVNAFGKEHANTITMDLSCDYNLWDNHIQYFLVNLSTLNEMNIDTLYFNVAGKKGTTGSLTVEIFLDPESSLDESEPAQIIEADPIAVEKTIALPIKDATVLAIRCTNHSGNNNTVVFYDFSNMPA